MIEKVVCSGVYWYSLRSTTWIEPRLMHHDSSAVFFPGEFLMSNFFDAARFGRILFDQVVLPLGMESH